MDGFAFKSGKTYTHNIGLSCCFRQWRATSHCNKLHGYALQVEFSFIRKGLGLDNRNWVLDFGGLKEVKAWLEETFDHKTLVAVDDPMLPMFIDMSKVGLIDMITVEHVGCEAFAKLIYETVQGFLPEDVYIETVVVREHAGNWASYGISAVPHKWPWRD